MAFHLVLLYFTPSLLFFYKILVLFELSREKLKGLREYYLLTLIYHLNSSVELCYLDSGTDVEYWYVSKFRICLNIQFYALNDVSKCHNNVQASRIGHGYVKQNEESE